MKNYGTREMVLAALGIALVYITTMFIKLPNSIGGYLNLGDSHDPAHIRLCFFSSCCLLVSCIRSRPSWSADWAARWLI